MTIESQRRRVFWQILLFAAGLVVLTVISAGSVYLVNKARDDSKWVVHTIEVENQINALLLEVRRAESSARGFLLTQGPDFQSEHEKAVAAIMPALDKLTHLIGDDPAQRDNIEKLGAAMKTRLDQLSREIGFVKQGQPDSAITLIHEAAAGDTTTTISNLANAMIREEERLFRIRTANSDRSQTLAASLTGIGSGLVVVLALISIWLMQRSARMRDEAEASLRDANLNLETIVDERTADLREANNEIQRFAYIVSHDLRSPLVNIMGFTSELEELGGDIFRRVSSLTHVPADGPPLVPDTNGEILLEGPDQQLSTDFSEALGFIKSSIAKMDRLISAILNLTREGRREFQPEKIDTHAFVEAIVSTLAHQAVEAQAEIHIERLPDIVSDRLALEQIFSNLIDNAIKYLKSGVPGEIRIRGRTKLGYAIFEISDNGRGIDARDHQRIFDLFRRAGTQDKPGQGIGLAHVRALVRRLGGTMSVSSELNTGSTFTITLPITWNATNRNADK
ncbi:CHASE3 domain-containing protein [Bradyrhizobium sp. GCM10027634]|uniref:sensor histidine kinase n=1 Tax=unclassified Bradyrhizobium TaxID=2631580 RepID=UPI00188BB1B4|nr:MULTISPECIES: CHASE3 domain-containing protein [unclassified Bradyrhizobium]MDN5001946.1 CHASE3 domain-containing protein [Bradyrhizobium sp. WYCCWR 12677]QOZ45771.1 histidine kinase [Bradyrhizobium sp. CCBAU 53340]